MEQTYKLSKRQKREIFIGAICFIFAANCFTPLILLFPIFIFLGMVIIYVIAKSMYFISYSLSRKKICLYNKLVYILGETSWFIQITGIVSAILFGSIAIF